ncbi:MAG: hypothetical protein KAR85_00255 [Methanosarcinales archaeon]|nr:hypothetical protein [Methanosarcinales archaeon]
MSEISMAISDNSSKQNDVPEGASGLVDLTSENAPDYLSGNVRRIKAEKARQERKKAQLQKEEHFFNDLLSNILMPKGLVTEKEKNFILIKDNATRSTNFWKTWIEKYELYTKLNGSKPLQSYKLNEFQEQPGIFLKGKMGSLPENIFDTNYYLEKIARFAADFQTEWKTPHFYMRKNAAGANVLEEESNTQRNQEAEQIVYLIWDLMDELAKVTESIIEYYSVVGNELAGGADIPVDPGQIYKNIFGNSRAAREFERERFQFLKDYAKVLFAVKENWEKRLDRTYDDFTNLPDVENSIDNFLEKRLAQAESMFD